MFKKFKTFGRTFWRSLTDLSYYKDIVEAKFSFSFKYLALLLFLVSLFWGVLVSLSFLRLIPRVPELKIKAAEIIKEIYPSELIISAKDKKLRTNVKEPYHIKFPEKDFNIVAIDTKAGTGDYSKYNSLFLLTGDALVAPQNKVYSLEKYLGQDGLLLNKDIYLVLAEGVIPYLNYLANAIYILAGLSLVALPLVGTLFNLLSKLVLILLVSLILFVLVKLLKKKYSFAKVYQLSMHGVTVPVILSFILSLWGFYLSPLVGFVILLLFMGLVFVKN